MFAGQWSRCDPIAWMSPAVLSRRRERRIMTRSGNSSGTQKDDYRMKLPDKHGHFGQFGVRYVSETLMPALLELEAAYRTYRNDREFKAEFDYYLKQYVGRPNPLYFAEKLTKKLGGAKIYLKREDLNHTGAHKVNNTIGQGLLARRMGKRRVIAET